MKTDLYSQFQTDRAQTQGVLLAIDKSASMGGIMNGDQRRMDIISSSILTFAKRFFDRQTGNNYTVPLSIVFFDSAATLGTF